MATYDSNYIYTTNAGPPSDTPGEQGTTQGGAKVFDNHRSSTRGRVTVGDDVLTRNIFLAKLGTLNKNNGDTDENDELRYAFGNIYRSSADVKVMDTRAGGSVGVGGPPAFTRYSDVRSKGLMKGRRNTTLTNSSGELGMGRLYSETIDDPQELLYLQFGVPMFNSLSGFLTKFSDHALVKLGTTGKASGFMYTVGQIAGAVFTARLLPKYITLALGAVWATSRLFARRTSRFYTVNPQMPLYWSAVNTLVNKLAINRGILPRALGFDTDEKLAAKEMMENISKMMPGMFHKTRGVDVPAVISTAQRRYNAAFAISLTGSQNRHDQSPTALVGSSIFLESAKKHAEELNFSSVDAIANRADGEEGGNLNRLIAIHGRVQWGRSVERNTDSDETNMMAMLPVGMDGGDRYTSNDSDETTEVLQTSRLDPAKPLEMSDKEQKLDNGKIVGESMTFNNNRNNVDTAGFISTLKALHQEGISWAVFRVNHIKSVTESFSNQTSSNSLGSGLNAAASTARSVKFSFAGGNIGDNMIMQGIEGVVSGITSLVEGAVDGFSFGVMGSVLDLLRGVTVDVPNYWEGASANVSTSTFSMDLSSPYNNVYSHIQNIYIPICMLAAGVWPIKSGAQSHVSPFVCKSHLLGKNKSALSMIKNVNVQRGTSNLPFDNHGHALAMKVTFELVNLSPAISSPISLGSHFRPAEWALDEDSAVFEYLEMLGGMTLEEQVLSLQSLRVRFASIARTISRLTDPVAWANVTHQFIPNIPVIGAAYNFTGGVFSTNTLMRGELKVR